ncbi:MAG: UvrD-helicase domain-containing protein [Polyangiaceae bacterium]|nr:UvrD-helicase domain-containing protein [Polyangiaceae bacterium]
MTPTGLNPPQRAAVQTVRGPLLVLAGAGTGKTRVITFRIARLIQSGVAPDRILAVTFTNKAAREMQQRAATLLGRKKRGATRPEISTFHSLCVRILRRHARRLGFPPEFAIYDRGDQETLARGALRDIRVAHQTLRPSDLIAQIGAWKTHGVRPPEAETRASNDRELLAALAFARYQTQLRAAGALDFDDLLLETERLFRDFPEARFAEATRFDHILVDEYQDTNRTQYEVVRALAERHRNLCVVGDDDQSIYGWRGADVSHILSFTRDWPDAKVVKLEDNYRSRAPILALANTLIAHNGARHGKVLRASKQGGDPPRFVRFDDETTEADSVVREIRGQLDAGERGQGPRVTPSDYAILFRTNEQPRAFEAALRRDRVPYVLVGGQSFFDRKEVRDLLAYLKVLANPNDEVSLLRVFNVPPRGLGAGVVETLLGHAVERGLPLWGILPDAEAGLVAPPVAARITAFRRQLEGFRARLGREPLAALLRDLVHQVDYKREVVRAHGEGADADARWAAVEELVNAVAQYEARSDAPSLQGFLETTALDARDEDDDERKGHSVTLMTLHSAKGLEFSFVYLVGMEEGLMPHQRSVLEGRGVEEERRLCYVGVTRAQERLTLTLCKARMKWGKLRPSLPSRFVLEMRGETERARLVAEASERAFRAAAAGLDDPEAEPEQATKAKKSTKGRKPTKAKKPTKGTQPTTRTKPATRAKPTTEPQPAAGKQPTNATRAARSAARTAPAPVPSPGAPVREPVPDVSDLLAPPAGAADAAAPGDAPGPPRAPRPRREGAARKRAR